MNHPDEKAGIWKNTTLRLRIKDCISMLHVRGFLSDTECRKVVLRVRKWLDQYEDRPLPKKAKSKR